MNIVDVVIVLAVVSAVGRGLRIGAVRLALSALGLLGGLWLGASVARWLAPHFGSPLARLAVVVSTVLLVVSFCTGLTDRWAHRIRERASHLKLRGLDKALGVAGQIGLTLVVVWLLASVVSNVRSYSIGRDVRRSWIVQRLNATMPPPPDIMARLEKVISLHGFPNVFLGQEPQHTTVSPTNDINNQAVLAAQKSMVKIQGMGCGGIVDGSGFVTAGNMVVTNAHVVAGIREPQVLDQTRKYAATPVWFDADLDIAILHVAGITGPPLAMHTHTLPNSSAAAVLGYPGGGPLITQNAVIIDHLRAIGRNIYNEGIVRRTIYTVQAQIEPGNSGGPLLAPDGTVAGVIFAKSLSQDGVGYAILSDQVAPLLAQARSNQAVSTGACSAN